MNFAYKVVRKVLFGGKRASMRRQAQSMDPATRRALQTTVEEETVAMADELQQVQAELDQAVIQWEAAIQKEQFLGLRTRQYRKALDERAQQLSTKRHELLHARERQEGRQPLGSAASNIAVEQGEQELDNTVPIDTVDNNQRVVDDEEVGTIVDLEAAEAELDRQMEKWEKDEDALASIVETHKQIVANCEQMRRNIKKLQKKRKKIVSMTRECQDFVQTAELSHNNEEEEEDDDDESERVVDEVGRDLRNDHAVESSEELERGLDEELGGDADSAVETTEPMKISMIRGDPTDKGHDRSQEGDQERTTELEKGGEDKESTTVSDDKV